MKKSLVLFSLCLLLLSSCGDGMKRERLDLYINRTREGTEKVEDVKYIRFNFEYLPYVEVPVTQYQKEYQELLRHNVLYSCEICFMDGAETLFPQVMERIDFRSTPSEEKPDPIFSLFNLYVSPRYKKLGLSYMGGDEYSLEYDNKTKCSLYNVYSKLYEEKQSGLIREAINTYCGFEKEFEPFDNNYHSEEYAVYGEVLYSKESTHLLMMKNQKLSRDYYKKWWKQNVQLSDFEFSPKEGKNYALFVYDEKANTSTDLQEYFQQGQASKELLEAAYQGWNSL